MKIEFKEIRKYFWYWCNKYVRTKNIWLFFLILILGFSAIWGIFYIDDIDSKVSVLGIVAVIVAAFTSVITVNINNKKIQEREYELHLLKEKQKVCEHFYNALFEGLKSIKKNGIVLNEKTTNERFLFKKGLMNWGSEELIKKYLKYEDNLKANEDDVFMIDNADTFLKEIRKELGFKDSKNIELMKIILTPEARKELEQKRQHT